jgi:hypothetical protein
MSRTQSLLAAGGLTAVVLVAVLIVGARHGAFGLGTAPAAVALPAVAPANALDVMSPEPLDAGDQPERHNDDEADDLDDHRAERRTDLAHDNGGRNVSRDHDDDED